jgi:ElaB/YqjD/DUF883 family membrane-anchored ribosome-binding protein
MSTHHQPPPAGDPADNGSIGASSSSGDPTCRDPGAASGVGAGPSARRGSTSRTEFGAFLDDLTELARGTAPPNMRRELEQRVSQARERIDEMLDPGAELSTQARERMQRGLDASRNAVTERPLSCLAIAAVGGLVLGLLLNRRH